MDFGIYHVDGKMKPDAFDELLESDFCNTFLVGHKYKQEKIIDSYRKIYMHKKRAWVYFSPLLFDLISAQKMVDVGENFYQKMVFKSDWENTLTDIAATLQKENFYSCIDGLYIDEPLLCGISLEDFKILTKRVREIFPNKRMFCCFSIAGVAPDIWTTDGIKPITADAGQYLTDIAFDMYHKFDWKYEYITNQMKERLGNRSDLKIWHIPCTMNYRGDKDEQHCIEHLQGCVNLLMSEKSENRGGLMCFTYHTFPKEHEDLGNIGLDNLRGQSGTNWKQLWSLMVKTGLEFAQERGEL